MEHWTRKLASEMESMSTLKYLKPSSLKLGKLHGSLSGDSNQHTISRTTVATKILVRRYPLSNNRVSGRKRDNCILCEHGEEDEKHFLLLCPRLRDVRLPLLQSILDYCRKLRIDIDPDGLTALIINPDEENKMINIQPLCKNFIYKLHCKRSELLSPQYKSPNKAVTSHRPQSGSPK